MKYNKYKTDLIRLVAIVIIFIFLAGIIAPVVFAETMGATNIAGETGEGNDGFTWKFNAMAVPSVSERNVTVQSVVENYDVSEPIIIFGKFFEPHVEVFFNGIRAYRTGVYEDEQKRYSTKKQDNIHYDKEDNENNNDIEQYLRVYLPRGRNKLGPGLYNITIENSRNHSVELYGTLSVVPKANRKIPTEEDKYSTVTPYGFAGGSSKIELIRLDHKEPIKEEILRKQLLQYTLRSPIVKIDGSDYAYAYIYILEIPYENGIETEFKVLRYSEALRGWTKVDFYVNNIDKRVIVISPDPGIFAVVESK